MQISATAGRNNYHFWWHNGRWAATDSEGDQKGQTMKSKIFRSTVSFSKWCRELMFPSRCEWKWAGKEGEARKFDAWQQSWTAGEGNRVVLRESAITEKFWMVEKRVRPIPNFAWLFENVVGQISVEVSELGWYPPLNFRRPQLSQSKIFSSSSCF